MTFLDIIARNEKLDNNEKVSGHTFEQIINLYLLGDKLTRTEVIQTIPIKIDYENDFDQIRTIFDGLKDDTEKIKWLLLLQSCILLIQQRLIDKTQFNQILGLSLDEK